MSRKEKVVTADLDAEGYEAYLPLVKTRRKWSDRYKWIEEPLFRSYVFVKVSQAEYYNILKHKSVLKYVSFGGKPCVVPDRQIEAVKRALGENVDFKVTSQHFKPGQLIEVTAGPMSGCSGEVVRYAGRKSLLLRIGDTGYSMLVQMPAAYIESREVALQVACATCDPASPENPVHPDKPNNHGDPDGHQNPDIQIDPTNQQ